MFILISCKQQDEAPSERRGAAVETGFSQLSIPEVETEASGVQRPAGRESTGLWCRGWARPPSRPSAPRHPLFLPCGPGRSESVLGPARPGLIGCDPSPKMHSGHLSPSCTAEGTCSTSGQRSLETKGFPALASNPALNSPARTSHLPTRGERLPWQGAHDDKED